MDQHKNDMLTADPVEAPVLPEADQPEVTADNRTLAMHPASLYEAGFFCALELEGNQLPAERNMRTGGL